MTSMQRTLGIKRSFHCEDLASISDGVAAVGPDRPRPNADDAPRSKRRRTTSAAPSCAVVGFCDDDAGETSPSAPPASSFAATPPSAPPALISPATSQAAVAPVTPPLAPAAPRDAVPRFPSLGGGATAALERFMRQETRGRSTLNQVDDDFAPSFEEGGGAEPCHAWPTFDHQEEPSSPCRIEDFPWPPIRVPTAPKTTSFMFHTPPLADGAPAPPSFVEATFSSIKPFSCFQVAASLQLLPSNTALPKAATLHHITEALSRL